MFFYISNLEIYYVFIFVVGMCASSPNIESGLQIGRQAELYLTEKNDMAAVDKMRTALGLLVPLLETEPPGQRRDLLHYQVQIFDYRE